MKLHTFRHADRNDRNECGLRRRSKKKCERENTDKTKRPLRMSRWDIRSGHRIVPLGQYDEKNYLET